MTAALQSGKTSVQPLYTEILELPPSCLEFSPKHLDYFVIGTYNLVKEEAGPSGEVPDDALEESSSADAQKSPVEETKKSQTRNGSIILYKVTSENL